VCLILHNLKLNGSPIMAEAFQRTHSDRTTYGYRQLAGTGAGTGPDLKTLVFGTVGTALGIVFGTLLASGGLHATNQASLLHGVQAGSVASVSAPAPAVQVPQTVKASAATPVTHPAAQAADGQMSVAENSTPAKASAARSITVSEEHPVAHHPFSAKRHLVRRWHRARHRVHPPELANAPAGAPFIFNEANSGNEAKPFIFTVEGDVSVANYDALSQTIDTYEGESFSLDQAPSATTEVAWQDNVHYRCDQSGNCDLVRAGQAFTNTHRTK
jgi:hypothetical protein